MVKIKIISNPYQKEVRYQKWVEERSEWDEINYANNRNSRLLSNELTQGFFPFKVKKIVDIIIDEYGIPGEGIEIYFEGSTDEYLELAEVCSGGGYEYQIKPIRSDIGLENARDILPEVKELFQEMSPLIMKSANQEKIERDLARFSDASSDVVPVCVLGNYSAGKSTFINALIGSEILKSGIEPVTAKIYKISRSKYSDRARVRCTCRGEEINLHFTEGHTRFDFEKDNNELAQLLLESLSDMDNDSIVLRVKKALEIINDYEDADLSDEAVSDLIEVEMPFTKGVLAQSQHPFVIFDTPGSNSASNAKHLKVLKQAMASMTNGLPIFLSTPDSLDSTDNENLYHIIHDMEELDDRFTMIVVNKADGPGLQRRDSTLSEQQRILNQSIPRNLYSGGIYYLSSILGLGAKNKGDFIDDFYAEIYDDQIYKYSNPKERRYKTLYKFNIMPAQIKKRADEEAEKQEDLVYANSGLFSVETEIVTFAGKYAAYNKCVQSQMFLKRIISITEEEIAKEKNSQVGFRQTIRDKLETDKAELIKKLEETAEGQKEENTKNYPEHMGTFLVQANETFSTEELKEKEKELTAVNEEAFGFNEKQDALKDSIGNVFSNFKPGKGKLDLKGMFDSLQKDFKNASDQVIDQLERRHQIDVKTADELAGYVGEQYDKRLHEIFEMLDTESRKFWTEKTENLRTALANTVAGSEVLTEARRRELEGIIINYEKLTFEEKPTEEIFNAAKFKFSINLGVIHWQADHLNINSLAATYNDNFKRNATNRYESIKVSHSESAHKWIADLLDVITQNIVEYSPELSRLAEQIRETTAKIEELIERENRLKEYTVKLEAMMDWKQI